MDLFFEDAKALPAAAPAPAAPSRRARHRAYTRGEELASSLSHALAALVAVVGLVVAVRAAVDRGDAWHVVSAAVYGSTLVLLFASSALYHGATRPRAKDRLQILDHVAIYLLIAGTYTPFTLITLRGPWGWSIFGAIWGLAVVGVSAEAFWVHRPKGLSALVYIGMSWIIVFATRPLLASLEAPGVWLLFGGGAFYTLGTLFYVAKRVRYTHAVWHLFVIGGAACHYVAVLRYVMP